MNISDIVFSLVMIVCLFVMILSLVMILINERKYHNYMKSRNLKRINILEMQQLQLNNKIEELEKLIKRKVEQENA